MRENSMNSNRKCMEIQELKKEVNNWNEKLKHHDHELQKIKIERNLYAKNLVEAKVCNDTIFNNTLRS